MKIGFTLAIILLVSASAITAELNAVILNAPRIDKGKLRVLPNDHGIDLEKYGISVRFYWLTNEKTLDREAQKLGISTAEFKERFAEKLAPEPDTFVEALSKAKFLYIAQYSGEAMNPLAQKPEYAEAVRKFLKNGGTLFLDLFSVCSYATKLLDAGGIASPCVVQNDHKGLYPVVPSGAAVKHPLLNFPHKIRGRQSAYGGYYSSAFPGQLPLFVKETSTEFPAVILQEKAFGKGRVIFCQVPAFFRNSTSDVEAGKMLENILSYVYDVDIRKEAARKLEESGGPGEDI
ncbi:MAG: hypothetical protein A2020_07220 [Lentisphaerae bacterium GWF2_45_14]|nr:MAG: hypothetical protein A2020_07220 [Lentisphaerae bacterium GWF2_45_14]